MRTPHPAVDNVVRHVYVHVPFCPQICPFCSFHVVRRSPGVVGDYLDRVDREAAAVADRFDVAPQSTYLGGGTPSMLRNGEMATLLGSLRRRFGSLGSEVTLEVHPSTASPDRFAQWRELGVTRFSIGVESTDDAVLARLGRSHRAADALAAVDAALTVAGADDDVVVSVDLMTAIDGQDVVGELARVASLGVDHISCYTLTVEEGTPFERDGVVVDSDVAAAAYHAADDILSAAGFTRYEVSNHAVAGAECRHNRGYWLSDWWVGLGPSAAGHLPPDRHSGDTSVETVGERWVNQRLGAWLDGVDPEVERLDRDEWAVHALVAGLRLRDGVDLDEIAARSGVDLRVRLAAALEELEAEGLTRLDGPRLAATTAAVPILDTVLARLFG